MKPVVAIVGRPNVGKSTLFNRLTKSRDAIVADFAGLTRDRHYGDARFGEHEFIVVDTGGFEPDKPSGVVAEMAKQTKQAVAEADAVIFVVDVRTGVSGQDHDIARYLRSANKRVFLAVNKAEGMSDSPHLAEFHELGIGEPHPVSAAHGQGIRSLIDAVLEGFDFGDGQDNYRRRGRAADPPGRGGPAQRGQEHPDQYLARRGAPDRLRPAGHDPRCDPCAVRAGRAEVRIDRYRGPAPKGQGLRGHREVLGGQDAAGDRRRERGCLAARCHPGRERPGRAHCRLHPRRRPRGGDRDQQVGRGRQLPARHARALDRIAAGVPEIRRAAAHFGAQAAGTRPAVAGHRRRAWLGEQEDADAGPDPAACSKRWNTRPPSAPGISGPSCDTPTRAA